MTAEGGLPKLFFKSHGSLYLNPQILFFPPYLGFFSPLQGRATFGGCTFRPATNLIRGYCWSPVGPAGWQLSLRGNDVPMPGLWGWLATGKRRFPSPPFSLSGEKTLFFSQFPPLYLTPETDFATIVFSTVWADGVKPPRSIFAGLSVFCFLLCTRIAPPQHCSETTQRPLTLQVHNTLLDPKLRLSPILGAALFSLIGYFETLRFRLMPREVVFFSPATMA